MNIALRKYLPAIFILLQASGLFAQDANIVVMTLNIRYDNPADGVNSWDNRKDLVVKTISGQAPDIIGMQEALERQVNYLHDHLQGYGFVGVGRDDGKSGGEYSPVFFNSSKFTVQDWGTLWLSPTPNDTGSVGWDAALPRICTWVRFGRPDLPEAFYFMNTHFDHMGQIARKESARLIIDFIKDNTDGLPVILTGDFNCAPGSEPYSVLTQAETGLKDACMQVPDTSLCGDGTFNGFGSAGDTERIDLILLSGQWTAHRYDLLKIKAGDMFISDHYPVVAEIGLKNLIVQTFTFDSIVTRRATFPFPEKGGRYEKILMYYTLKCDSLTPHDKYPCGEWDYTTYTRVFHKTGRMDSVKYAQASFVVKGQSPKTYLYSLTPTYTFYEYQPGIRQDGIQDYFARFAGSDCIEVPGEAFSGIKEEITVSFWLNGDPQYQPMASTIFEGLDKEGLRVINLHIPYDNGVVYWDAGGHGDGLTDNIYKAAEARDYKGRWTHWTVTKNSITGEQKIYLNGTLFQKGSGLKRVMDGISTFRIGSNGKGDGRFYRGSLDDFAIWGRELDSAEVLSLFSSGISPFSSRGLITAYDFNDAGQLPGISDISGHSFNGKTFGHPALLPFDRLPYPEYKPVQGMPARKDSTINAQVSIIIYGDSLTPGIPTDTLTAWPGYHYYCNSRGLIIDSAAVSGADTLIRKTRTWYGDPFEVTEQFEIGRFITPYGKRLDLGLNGFTWVYDVTDYAPLLHGMVDLQAANGQELLDLKFLFIKGIPPRDVISIKNIWPEGSYVYRELADDEQLQATNIRLHEDASTFMLRARISGHGHYGPYNCCEWDPKEHSWLLNGEERYRWTVWRDCGMNPVHPQGGTWQFDRAGWCPGTFVDTYDYEMTSHVKPGEMLSVDYQIEPYDQDNGEEGGNYEMAMHLFAYSAPNYRLDLELNDILAPSKRHEYRRMNPVSMNPVIRVRNSGSDTVTAFTVSYGLKDGIQSSFEWSGKLGFMESADICLPKPSWNGLTEQSVFAATILHVNGRPDDRSSNNTLESGVTAPIILPGEFLLHVKTQGFGRAADNAYRITGSDGKVVKERLVFKDTTTYSDRVRLKPGAYDFTFTDKNEDGMIRHWWLYWSDPDKVGENGELKILDKDRNLIMDLGHDFAEKRTLQFFVGEPQ